MTNLQICSDKTTDGSQLSSFPEQDHGQASCHSAFGVPTAATQSLCLPSNVAIEPITPATVPSFRRLIGLLLPIRYPDKFFAESVANATPSSLARVATWYEETPSVKRKRDEASSNVEAKPKDATSSQNTFSTPTSAQQKDALRTVVGGIQCRIEQLPFHPSQPTSSNTSDTLTETRSYCYIQTLALLSPYRFKGIAAALLEVIVTTLCKEQCYAGMTSVYAHVWEENEVALQWYVRRGFQVSKEVLKGYYRRLKPDGARVVWRDLGVNDHLRTQSRGK
ncbi:MAG: hypothetical protein L6R38_003424 [Xanthoria sp. 2 TBL-2021]|nr:MAG: hypothetical protein L6R38_003424 [Xanthoria sp. 2 TBL-2021]